MIAMWLAMAWGAGIPRSETLLLSGNVTAALAAVDEEVAAQPDDVSTQERRIDILLGLGAVTKAVEGASDRVEANPLDADAHYLLGRALPEAREARQAYERALKIDPLHARSHMGMGAIHTALGDLPSAAAAYGRAVRIDATLAEAWLGAVRTQLALDQLETAREMAKKAVLAVPDAADAWLTVAALHPDQGRELLATAATRAGHDPRIHALLSQALLDAGEASEAVRSAKAALAIDPTEPTALRVDLFARQLVAGTLDMAGMQRLREAKPADVEALVAAYPRTPVTWLARANGRLAADDLDGALADLRVAQKLAPDEIEVLGQLGLLLEHRKEHADAAPLLTRASRARPWDAGLALAAGGALSGAGRHEEAIRWLSDLEKRLQYDSRSSIALADALLRNGDAEAAYQVVLAATERKTDPQILVALMTMAAQSGRYDEAASMLEEIGRKMGNPKALELASKLRAKAGQ